MGVYALATPRLRNLVLVAACFIFYIWGSGALVELLCISIMVDYGAGLYTGSVPEIMLPIGISFFTFQSMSYTIDVARGRCDHLTNPIDFALHVTLFPQLIAGPIVRYHAIESQIRSREFNGAQFGNGAARFSHGLVKKVIIADTVASTSRSPTSSTVSDC